MEVSRADAGAGENMVWSNTEERKLLNEHLHRFHGGVSIPGPADSKRIAHELLHANGIEGVAGFPPHRHPSADSLDAILVENAAEPDELEVELEHLIASVKQAKRTHRNYPTDENRLRVENLIKRRELVRRTIRSRQLGVIE